MKNITLNGAKLPLPPEIPYSSAIVGGMRVLARQQARKAFEEETGPEEPKRLTKAKNGIISLANGAGQQAAIEKLFLYEESGLFLEAIRIIEEMRESTNGMYPTFIIWENVPGAFSSNDRQDFRTVLEKITKAACIPMPGHKWSGAGMVRGGAVDTAWRVFNAEHWGVPQRRRRIYLVGDFGGQRAGEILFKPESVLGYPTQGNEEETQITGNSGNSTNAENPGSRVAGFTYKASSTARGIGYKTDVAPTLKTDSSTAIVKEVVGFDISHADAVVRTFTNSTPALLQRMGTGGNQVPIIAESIKENLFYEAYQHHGYRESKIAGTMTAGQNDRIRGDTPLVVRAIKENVIPIRSETTRLKESNGLGIGKPGGPAPTLTANDIHNVFYGQRAYDQWGETETGDTLKATGGSYGGGSENLVVRLIKKSLRAVKYIIRRLTPRECERLQGYPDDWTRWGADGQEIAETARYRAIGNSIAVPCAVRVFLGIVSVLERGSEIDGGKKG